MRHDCVFYREKGRRPKEHCVNGRICTAFKCSDYLPIGYEVKLKELLEEAERSVDNNKTGKP